MTLVEAVDTSPLVGPVETKAFLEVFSDKTGGNPRVQTSEYLKSGKFPIIDQGQKDVAGYSNDESLLAAPRGPVIIFGDHTRILKYIDGPFILGADGTKVLVSKINADVRYLFHYLRFVDLPSAGYSRHFKFLKEVHIPLPPLPEQRRIAAILDKADHLRAQRREALAHLDALTQSIFNDMFGNPQANPQDFDELRLSDLGEWKSGGTPPRSNASYFDGAIPWYLSGELDTKYLGNSKENITKDAVMASAAKLIEPGSLLLGMYDTAALKSGITTRKSTCNQAIAFGSIDPAVALTSYVYECVQISREHFMSLRRGIRQKNLNLAMIKALIIPVPPLELQQTFARRVTAVERLREQHRTQLAELDALFASLQHRAFTGKL